MAGRIYTNTLSADFRLHFLNMGNVTVADVLANPRRFDFERLADPADPTYADDPRIAVFFANGGKARPHIFSHAHGGCKYVLAYASNSSETSQTKEANNTTSRGNRDARIDNLRSGGTLAAYLNRKPARAASRFQLSASP